MLLLEKTDGEVYMNNNIFNPKGMTDELHFVLYYILLILLYIVGGICTIIFVYKHNLNSAYFVLPFLLLKILIMFNYKKRLMHISHNLPLSVILGFILAFDTEALAACGLIKDTHVSTILFFVLLIFMLVIQPAIVTLIPGKEEK